MEQKINILELLKDCPSGMELDCTIWDSEAKVFLKRVLNDDFAYPIEVTVKYNNNEYSKSFTKYGAFNDLSYCKCVIFPKGKNTWEGFQRPFNDGDVIFGYNSACSYIAIYKSNRNEMSFNYYACLTNLGRFKIDHFGDNLNLRLASEEEKQKLFDEIKTRGYKWNPETKTLEKLVKPKFKVGDEIVKRNSITNSWIVNSVSSEYYGLKLPNGFEGIGVLPVSEQDDWELITNKLEKSVEPKFKVGDRIRNIRVDLGNIYTIIEVKESSYTVTKNNERNNFNIDFVLQDDWVVAPNKFDITTLKPFDSRVLVRTGNGKWVAAFYSHYNKNSSLRYCVTGGSWYEQCIPYNGNGHLLNTTDDCDDFYKTWK